MFKLFSCKFLKKHVNFIRNDENIFFWVKNGSTVEIYEMLDLQIYDYFIIA